MFADDTTIYTSHKSVLNIEIKLQRSLEEIDKWCKNNDMILHPNKTKSMIVTTRQKHQIQPLEVGLILNCTPILQGHTHRHLGITIDDKLTWHPHIYPYKNHIPKSLFTFATKTVC